jgi:hypothetical protein
MEPFRWRRALFLGLVSSAASLAALVLETFVPVWLQAGHPLWHKTTGRHVPPGGCALAPSLSTARAILVVVPTPSRDTRCLRAGVFSGRVSLGIVR